MFKKYKKIFWVTEDDSYENIDLNWQEELDYEDVLTPSENIGQIALDIIDTWTEIIILAPVAWVEFKDIDLSFHNQVLTIKWNREKPDIYYENVTVKNAECFWWRFERKIILPENLDFEKINASIENNMLVVRIPKLHFSNSSIQINRL